MQTGGGDLDMPNLAVRFFDHAFSLYLPATNSCTPEQGCAILWATCGQGRWEQRVRVTEKPLGYLSSSLMGYLFELTGSPRAAPDEYREWTWRNFVSGPTRLGARRHSPTSLFFALVGASGRTTLGTLGWTWF